MTEATGGFAVTDTDDYTSGLDRIIEDLDHYYLLGFYPSDPGRTTGFLAGLARAAGSGSDYRPLEVKVRDHPDWTVRSRKGYRPGGAPPPPVNKDPLVALAAGVLPKADLPLRLYATVFPGERRLATIAAAIEITAPTKALLGPDAKLHDQVSYGVLVVDEKKTKVTSRTNLAARIALKPRVAVPSPEDDPNMPSLVSYQIPLTLELGTWQVSAARLGHEHEARQGRQRLPDDRGAGLREGAPQRSPASRLAMSTASACRWRTCRSRRRGAMPARRLPRRSIACSRRPTRCGSTSRSRAGIRPRRCGPRSRFSTRRMTSGRGSPGGSGWGPWPRGSQAALEHARAWRLPLARHRQRRHEQRGARDGDCRKVVVSDGFG